MRPTKVSHSLEEAHLRSRVGQLEHEQAILKAALLDGGPRACTLAFTSYAGHFRVLLQFFLSYVLHVHDAHACNLLVLTSSSSEVASLNGLLHSPEHAPRLASLFPLLHVLDFPTVLERLSPGTITALPLAKNRGQHGRLYVCAKKAYAVRYAHEVLDSAHVVVTDSEAYVWKPLHISQLIAGAAARPTVWYADAPAHARPSRALASGTHAAVDQNWCSMHVYGDVRGLSREAIRARLPSTSASFFEYMLFYYPRDEFRGYWGAVEGAWHRPWFDSLVAAHEAEPRCVAVGFWLEVSSHHRTSRAEPACTHPLTRTLTLTSLTHRSPGTCTCTSTIGLASNSQTSPRRYATPSVTLKLTL